MSEYYFAKYLKGIWLTSVYYRKNSYYNKEVLSKGSDKNKIFLKDSFSIFDFVECFSTFVIRKNESCNQILSIVLGANYKEDLRIDEHSDWRYNPVFPYFIEKVLNLTSLNNGEKSTMSWYVKVNEIDTDRFIQQGEAKIIWEGFDLLEDLKPDSKLRRIKVIEFHYGAVWFFPGYFDSYKAVYDSIIINN